MKLHLSFFSLLFLSFYLYGQDTLGVLTPDRPGFGDAVFITPKKYLMIETGFWTENQKEVGHYGQINLAPGNTRLDQRLRPNGFGQNLNLNQQEVDAVIAFLKTLTGSAVYSDPKWADPFQ